MGLKFETTTNDFRLLEAVLLLVLFSMNQLSELFFSEHYRFATFLIIVACVVAYYFVKIGKDKHSEIAKNDTKPLSP